MTVLVIVLLVQEIPMIIILVLIWQVSAILLEDSWEKRHYHTKFGTGFVGSE